MTRDELEVGDVFTHEGRLFYMCVPGVGVLDSLLCISVDSPSNDKKYFRTTGRTSTVEKVSLEDVLKFYGMEAPSHWMDEYLYGGFAYDWVDYV